MTSEFSAAVRGFHFYRNWWFDEASEIQQYHKCGNVFDIFAVKTCSLNENAVGHLLREISRMTKFLIERGAIVQAMSTTTDYGRSLLVRGWWGVGNHKQNFCENVRHNKNH